jgi:hypothetical protein
MPNPPATLDRSDWHADEALRLGCLRAAANFAPPMWPTRLLCGDPAELRMRSALVQVERV